MKLVCKVVALGGFTASFGVSGCAAGDVAEEGPPPVTDVPVTDVPDEDTTDPRAAITVNGFTLNAKTPTIEYIPTPFPIPGLGALYYVHGSVVISGGSGTAKMGVCAMLQHKDGATPRVCSTVADCANIPIMAGGSRYCTNVNNVGQKYCFTRLETSMACAGTPATGAAVGNGTYTTGTAGAKVPGQTYISYACINACSTTDPSVSSSLAFP